MKAEIRTIPHRCQRYNTLGDYRVLEGIMRIWVSEMGNEDYNFLIGVHELIEFYLTQRVGISEESITNFDVHHPELDDPGSSALAPYHKEHMLALKIEKQLAKFMGVNWSNYERRMEDICAG